MVRLCVNCGGGEFEESAEAIFTVTVHDSDQDGYPDDIDNCPAVYNKDQADIDKDGVGDACDKCDDRDSDGDGIPNCTDICPDKAETFNDYQDGDGCPDSAPPSDIDGDGVPDVEDNCPSVSNQDQADADLDGVGDACDSCDDRDSDGDGIINCQDSCVNDPEVFNKFEDSDGCPDKLQTKGGEKARDMRITISSSPFEPSLGDEVRLDVNVSDPSGVRLIEIYLNGLRKRRCFNTMECTYTTTSITGGATSIGVRAFNGEGNFGVEGAVPDEVRRLASDLFEDSDDDGILNYADNCVDDHNPDQTDSDFDGVGDACDRCDAIRACGFTEITPAGPSYSCRETSSRSFSDYGRIYDSIGDDGCGCVDPDRGGENMYLSQGTILEERVDTDFGSFMGRDLCIPLSSCEPTVSDSCIDQRQLEELSCGPRGVESETIMCGSWCIGGKCICTERDRGPGMETGLSYYVRGGGNRGRSPTDSTFVPELCVTRTEGGGSVDTPGNTLKEIYCSPTGGQLTVLFDCPFGCRDGVCICEDTDGGSNITVRGSIGGEEFDSEKIEDYCLDDRRLLEFYTELRGNSCSILNHTVTCFGACRDGACVPPSCMDKIQNGNEDGVDCGGDCFSCDLCTGDFDPSMLPPMFDWRSYEGVNWVTDVRNQGSCGSCWAFSAIGSIEAKYNVEQGIYGIRNQLNLSEQDAVSCGDESSLFHPDSGTCSGGWPRYTFSRMRRPGISDEACFPYNASDISCSNKCDDWEGRLWNIESAWRVRTGSISRIDRVKQQLICGGPLSISSSSWSHAVVLVGYDDFMSSLTNGSGSTVAHDPSNPHSSTQGRWIIKNSWGTGWGQNGYGFIPYTGHRYSDIKDRAIYPEGVTRGSLGVVRIE